MSNERQPKTSASSALRYQIRIKGHVNANWTDWFSGWTITLDANGETCLTGLVADQAALHGVLRRIRDLGMPLLAITSLDAHSAQSNENQE